MSAPDLPPQLEDPTGFPDGATAEVERRPAPPDRPFDVRRFALLVLVLAALLAGSFVFVS